MSIKKSKPYSIGSPPSKYSFEFDDDGKLIGVKKQDENGNFQPVDPTSNEFNTLKKSDQALNAYNVNKFGGNTGAYEDSIKGSTGILGMNVFKDLSKQIQYFNQEKKKLANQQFLEDNTLNKNPLAFTTPQSPAFNSNKTGGYNAGAWDRFWKGKSDVMAYPLDIALDQDHLKITRYNYIRPDINQSKPSRRVGTHKMAGDGVVGSKIKGSVFLPMPKPVDTLQTDWGQSDMSATEIMAMGDGYMATLGGVMSGKSAGQLGEEAAARMRARNTGDIGNMSLPGTINPVNRIFDMFGRGVQSVQGTYTQTVVNAANATFGTDIQTDEFLARTGGRVMNPNAEMIFQGPTIRGFPFQFQMIARSEDEGKEIRRIIKFFKEGMAVKYRNTTFLQAPDIFTLAYKNGKGDEDFLKTVNRFNPGGLALTNLSVDYAPSGYWSAYRDSQPVAVKIDMTFSELRPLYEIDQTDLKGDNVGY